VQLANLFLNVVHKLLLLILIIPFLRLIVLSLLRNEYVMIIELIDLLLEHVVGLLLYLHLVFHQVLLRLQLVDQDLLVLALFPQLLSFHDGFLGALVVHFPCLDSLGGALLGKLDGLVEVGDLLLGENQFFLFFIEQFRQSLNLLLFDLEFLPHNLLFLLDLRWCRDLSIEPTIAHVALRLCCHLWLISGYFLYVF